MKPSQVLQEQHDRIVAIMREHARLSNLRVFGSVARGEDTDASDIDFVVDPAPHTTLLDLAGLRLDLQGLFGPYRIKVDLATPRALPKRAREQILSEAKPV
ncbi:MAG TPA: nucleotidyltransferase family protein [Ideonella sp.]|uniref:nucleotidyltransferase family protein n=1 Tax=Ideonella sp. TaxID=1929293 RepID=UPI002C31D593|nr:nucleotidyltransferase family protein [Ideonella sp.]HSI50309.1 nucleotidyltransferase family protein [Ideonella sp.]